MDSVNGRRFTQQGRVAATGASARVTQRPANEVSRSSYTGTRNNANAQYGDTRVDQRTHEQQQRASGVHSAEMTPREAPRTENREPNMNHQANTDHQVNAGRPAPAERNNVSSEQNHANRQSNSERHNERTAPR